MSKIIDGLNDAVAYADGDKTRGKLVKAPKLSQEMQDCLNWLKLNPGWQPFYRSPFLYATFCALHKRGLVECKMGWNYALPAKT